MNPPYPFNKPNEEQYFQQLSLRIRHILTKASLATIEKCLCSSNITLSSIGLTEDEIKSIRAIAVKKYSKLPISVTALTIQWRRISFTCSALDKLTGGGISIRGVTEICGESGCGKSQISLHLALNVQLALSQGGLAKGAVFICTEDAFPSKRLFQLAKFYSKQYDRDDWLNNIFIEHVSTTEKLLDCVLNRLPNLMNQRSIGLIVIDSIAGVFRLDSNAIIRANEMRNLVLGLQSLSDKHECAVVCVNQVTAVINNRFNKNQFIPCLGLAWSNLVTTRMIIHKTNKCMPSSSKDFNRLKSQSSIQIRDLELIFSPEMPYGKAEFIITENGISNIQ